jgi:alkylation response protein AidB-like acyl-CoA dehydrogenase
VREDKASTMPRWDLMVEESILVILEILSEFEASCGLGGAAFCLDTAKEYVKSRKQFGKPLADFQNIQFKLADMATDLTASRLMVRNAASMIDAKVF